MNFGEYFKKLRTEHHMTQREIASHLGVTRQAISHWENNKNLPDLEMLIQIADTFDLSLDQLFVNGNTSENIIDKADFSETTTITDTTTSSTFTNKMHHHRHYTLKEIRRLKLNLLTFCIGAILLFFGIGYVGVDSGMENHIRIVTIICKSYILVPLGFTFIFASILAFVLFELKHLTHNLHKHTSLKKEDNTEDGIHPQTDSDSIITM